jgi:hypothetical protein
MSFKTKDGIRVFTREDWGARDPRGRYSPLGELDGLVYHHGGPVGGPRMRFKAAAATCRSWQAFHMDSHGWMDIGYHWLVDGLGRLYEGRPTWALGAHVAFHNTGNVGLNFMQDGRFHGLTVWQKSTLRRLLEEPHGRLGLPRLGDLVVARGSEHGVWPHRFFGGTECPGDLIDRDVKRVIRKVVG